jgi:hypothetical protein
LYEDTTLLAIPHQHHPDLICELAMIACNALEFCDYDDIHNLLAGSNCHIMRHVVKAMKLPENSTSTHVDIVTTCLMVLNKLLHVHYAILGKSQTVAYSALVSHEVGEALDHLTKFSNKTIASSASRLLDEYFDGCDYASKEKDDEDPLEGSVIFGSIARHIMQSANNPPTPAAAGIVATSDDVVMN